jgi:phosphoribosylpyrophosphate synthetase
VSKMMVFTGNANPDLARVVRQLHIPLGDISVGKFSDGEITPRSMKTSAVKTSSLFSRRLALRPTIT